MVKTALFVALSTLFTVQAMAQASEVKIKSGQSIEIKAGDAMKVTCEAEKKIDIKPPTDPNAALPKCAVQKSFFGGAFDVYVGDQHWGYYDQEQAINKIQELRLNAICK